MNCELGDMLDKFLWANVRYEMKKDTGPHFEPEGYLTDYLAKEAGEAIRVNKDSPFFMYLAFTSVHTPMQALKSDYDKLSHTSLSHCSKVYAAMLMALDRGVGTVLDSLKEHDLSDNTIVIFTSDNGAPEYILEREVNAPYRGWKASFFEGGIKVPFFMQWPKMIRPSSHFKPLISHIDILPTVLAAAGHGDSIKHDIDGVNLLPFLKGADILSGNSELIPTATGTGTDDGEEKDELSLVHDTLYWRSGHYSAFRKGKYKLQYSTKLPNKLWLYDMQKDPTEQYNLAYVPSFKALLKDMRASMAEEVSKHRESLWPSLSESPVLIDKLENEGYEEGDEYIYWAN